MPEFFFQRYVNGERMADDVLITKQATLEDAIPAALRLCRNSPKSVLVHIPQTPWRDIESAPKDGTKIVVGIYFDGGKYPEEARWDFWVDSWRKYASGYGEGFGEPYRPTHWMPLPEPPADTQTGER